MSRNPKRKGSALNAVLIVLILVMIAATALVIWMCIDLAGSDQQTTVSTPTVSIPTASTAAPTQATETQPPETTLPEPEHVVSTATIASQGDLLMHKPVFDTCLQSDGSYDFSSIFQYTVDLISGYDFALANLETTFGGDDYVYQGNPAFNCPDELIDAVVDTGYDLLLTANNHAGDTMGDGILRTIEQIRSNGLIALGSQLDGDEPKYSVVEINGIKIGMVCYTWAYSGNGSTFSLNGLTPVTDVGQMNYFTNNNPDKLYNEAEEILQQMYADGAEATMMFIHWGQEYQLTENTSQNQMAQRLCDMGFDVIVGGHPHVVQPVELLQSTVDPEHKTICIYSLGNAVSNQRLGNLSAISTAHTEDGVIFTVSFEKYSDGTVYISAVEVVPTWVNMHSNNGSREYNILPLDLAQEDQWAELFHLTDTQFTSCQRSYERTMDIVGEGLEQCQTWLEEAKAEREAYYADLALHPENYPEATAETTQNVPETTAATEAAA